MTSARRSSLKLLTSAASHPKYRNYPLPPPFLRFQLRGEATGDDCSVAGRRYLGVADGVGQWNRREHGSAGLWSRLMITRFADRMEQLTANEKDVDVPVRGVVDLLEEEYHSIMALCKHPDSMPTGPAPKGDWTSSSMSDPLNKHGFQPRHQHDGGKKGEAEPFEYQGSTTLLVSVLSNSQLHIVNIGDSSLLVFREGELVYESEAQSHWFDCPFQIGHNSPDTPANSAHCDTVDVQPGDVVITSTDGLGDNVYNSQILEVILEESAKEGAQQEALNRMAARLCSLAREKMADEWGESPFGDRAICEGIGFMGGKKDDVSILVSRVIEDE
ncbi:hypothetical protein PYCC9005_000605 [Savitreella phatthalungensis]